MVSELEGDDHVAARVPTVKALKRGARYRTRIVCSKCPLGNAVAGTYVEGEGLVMECETLPSVASAPYAKTLETSRKHKDVGKRA